MTTLTFAHHDGEVLDVLGYTLADHDLADVTQLMALVVVRDSVDVFREWVFADQLVVDSGVDFTDHSTPCCGCGERAGSSHSSAQPDPVGMRGPVTNLEETP